MRMHLSSRFAKNIAVVVAAIAIAGTAAGTASAETNCTGQPIVDRPGEHQVTGGPAHQGGITIGYSSPIAPMTVGQPWQFTLDEYNGTGAAYRNVAVVPAVIGWTETSPGHLDGMTPQNTHLQALVNGAWVNVPLATGCDPAMSINSTVVDHALPAGGHWKQTFRLTVDADVTPKLTSFQFIDSAYADGASALLSPNTVGVVRPASPAPQQVPTDITPAKPWHKPASATRGKAATTTAPTATPAEPVARPSTAPTAPAPQPSTATTIPSTPATATPTSVALKPVAATSAASGANGNGSLVLTSGLAAGLLGLGVLDAVRNRRRTRG